MDFNDMRIGMDILEKYSCGQNRDWGDEENRKIPIGGDLQFGHEQVWITLPRTEDNPPLTQDELKKLNEAGWFLDEEDCWSHY